MGNMVDLVHGMVDLCFGQCTMEQGRAMSGSSLELGLVATLGHGGSLRQRGNEEAIVVVPTMVEWM
jgi:hypothetical protein